MYKIIDTAYNGLYQSWKHLMLLMKVKRQRFVGFWQRPINVHIITTKWKVSMRIGHPQRQILQIFPCQDLCFHPTNFNSTLHG